jgi:hypothetical protein
MKPGNEMQPFDRTLQVSTFEQEVTDTASASSSLMIAARVATVQMPDCFLEALFVLRVGNFLTSWTSCTDARQDAL